MTIEPIMHSYIGKLVVTRTCDEVYVGIFEKVLESSAYGTVHHVPLFVMDQPGITLLPGGNEYSTAL